MMQGSPGALRRPAGDGVSKGLAKAGSNRSVPGSVGEPAEAGAEPAQRQAESRERILDAALREFARAGFAGARVDAIAARAGINKRMLYAYVGNKDALWLATLERAYAAKRAEEQALDLTRMKPREGMAILVRFNFRYHARHPEFLALLNDENLRGGRSVKRSARARALYSPLIDLIESLLRHGQEEGVFRGGIDPMQLYISIMALSYFYCSNRHTLSAIFGRDLGAPEEMLAREQHVVDVIAGYLRP